MSIYPDFSHLGIGLFLPPWDPLPLSFQPMPPSTMAGHGIPPSQGRR